VKNSGRFWEAGTWRREVNKGWSRLAIEVFAPVGRWDLPPPSTASSDDMARSSKSSHSSQKRGMFRVLKQITAVNGTRFC
jgi:hypothetical protein